MLTAEGLRELLDYDPATGVFRWKERRGRAKAGGLTGYGYVHIRVDDRLYQAHRLVWLYVHGRWPKPFIDHINGDRADNRLANLREATKAENGRNAGPKPSNTSGFKGVYWHGGKKKWHAQITNNGRQHHLGYFKVLEDGHAAYCAAAIQMHGAFARTE